MTKRKGTPQPFLAGALPLFSFVVRSFGLVAFAGCVACSTVHVRIEEGSPIREGISSAKCLQRTQADSSPCLVAAAEQCSSLLRAGRRLENSGNVKEALASYVEAALISRSQITGNSVTPGSRAHQELVQVHNSALALVGDLWISGFGRIKESKLPLTHGENSLAIVAAPDSDFSPAFFDRVVPSESIKSEGVTKECRYGMGAPLVGIREKRPGRESELKFAPRLGMHIPITLNIASVRHSAGSGTSHRTVSLMLSDPTRNQTVALESKRYPLAADFSAPIELLLKGKKKNHSGPAGFFDAKDRAEHSGIFLLQPYDKDRIPVVLVHGLISVPDIWRDIVPAMMAEPDIAKRYQFLVLTYPSSYPVAVSAQFFRQQLSAIRAHHDPAGTDPLSRNMVAVGHSMGGVLVHLLVADIGDRLWNLISDVPIDHLPTEEREILQDLVFFEPDPAVRRAVFYSTPHYGADLATLGIADHLSRVASLPGALMSTMTELEEQPQIEGLHLDLDKKVTSVQSLRPDSRISLTLKASPYKAGVTYHSIIGDRGKGDTPDSSDGVVAYWSSHQEGAASELIVPTGHTSYKHPAAVEELKRVLRVHAGLR